MLQSDFEKKPENCSAIGFIFYFFLIDSFLKAFLTMRVIREGFCSANFYYYFYNSKRCFGGEECLFKNKTKLFSVIIKKLVKPAVN